MANVNIGSNCVDINSVNGVIMLCIGLYYVSQWRHGLDYLPVEINCGMFFMVKDYL